MNYVQLPDDVLPKVRNWSAMQLAIWADVHTMNKAGMTYYRTNEQLAERWGADDRTVRRVVSQLIACGAVTAEQDGKRRILTAVLDFEERKRTKLSPDKLVPGQVSPRTNQSAKEDKLVRDGGPTGPKKEDQLVPQVEHRVEQEEEQVIKREETDRERMARLIAQMEARERGEEVPQAAEAIPVPATIRPARGAARAAVVSNKAQPFDVQEVIDYFLELEDTPEEAANFYDYWTSAGWRRKAGPIKDWKATARTWVRSPYRKPKPKTVIDTARAVMEDFLNNPR